MIIKTEKFDQILKEKVGLLSVNRKFPLKPVGSYPLKPFGSLINDIDYTEYIYFNEKLVQRLQDIIRQVESSKDFIFMYINCGRYPEFDLPWSFDNFGGCDFDYNKALEWLDKIYCSDLIPKETNDFLKSKFISGDEIYLKDIIDIESKFDSFRKIVWTKEDIIKGYKEVRGNKYDLLEQIIVEGKVVCKYIYSYTNESGNTGYVNVEVGLEEKGRERRYKNPTFSYYIDEWYSILKSLRWNIKKEYFDEYLEKIRKIETYLALRSQIELTKKIIKYKLLSSPEVKKLMEDSRKYMDELKLDYKGKKGTEIEDLLTQIINDYCKNLVHEYRHKLKDESSAKFNIYLDRADSSKKPVHMIDLIYRKAYGIMCPFYEVDINEYIYLHTLAERLLFSPNFFIDCIVESAKKIKLSIPEYIVRYLPQNNLYLMEDQTFIHLYDGEQKLSSSCKYKLDIIRAEILTGEKADEF